MVRTMVIIITWLSLSHGYHYHMVIIYIYIHIYQSHGYDWYHLKHQRSALKESWRIWVTAMHRSQEWWFHRLFSLWRMASVSPCLTTCLAAIAHGGVLVSSWTWLRGRLIHAGSARLPWKDVVHGIEVLTINGAWWFITTWWLFIHRSCRLTASASPKRAVRKSSWLF